jgi:PD-(D/E)XK nuclease superfamily
MPSSFPLHFERYDRLAADVAARLEERRAGDALQPWSEEVLVASSGVAQGIARELASRVRGGVAGLQLQTLDTFGRRLLNAAGEFPRIASDAERRLAMRAAVRSIDDPITQSRGIGAMLERSYRDMRDSGLTLREFRKRVPAAHLRNRERTALIVRAWTEYEHLITILGAVDAADVFARAAKLIDAGAPLPPQIVAGFYDMTGMQRAIIEALARAGKLGAMYVPATADDAYAFANPFIEVMTALGGVRTSSSATIGRPRPIVPMPDDDRLLPDDDRRARTPGGGGRGRPHSTPWTVSEHDRRDAEIRAVCARVARLLSDGAQPQSIGIVARSLEDADVHLFNRFAAEYGFRTTATEELPLIAHRIGRATVTILRLRERDFRRADVLEVVRDGLRTQTRINVDSADQETRQRHISGGTSEELRGRSEKSLVIGDYVRLVAELEELTAPLAAGTHRGAEWSALVGAIAARFSIRTPSDLAAVQQLDSVAALFARAGRMPARFDVASVVDAIEQLSIPVAADAGETPVVWLSDVMRFRGRSFAHLFAVRMQDEIFPQRRSDDPLVPDTDRAVLGVPMIGDGRDEERLLFQLVVDGASSSLQFSFSGSDGFGKALRPSQLLKNFVVARQPERKQELLENFAKACASSGLRGHEVTGSRGVAQALLPVPATGTDKSVCATKNRRQLQLIARAGTNGSFDGFIEDAALREHFATTLRHVSPTQLEDFGECPQKFLLKHILHVVDIEDPDRELELNPRDKGSLNHRILEHFYRGLSTADRQAAQARLPQLPPALVFALEAEIDREFDRLDEETPPFNRNVRGIERRAARRILRDFVAQDLEDLARNELVPRFFEYGFGDKYARRERGADHEEPFVISAGGIPICVEGQIDRIDVSEGVGGQGSGVGGENDGIASAPTARPAPTGGGSFAALRRATTRHPAAPPAQDDTHGEGVGAEGSPVGENGGIDSDPRPPTADPPPHYRIVDYKSGKALRHTKLASKIERGVRLQLALYAMAVSDFFGVDANAVSGTIKPIAGGDIKTFGFDLGGCADGVRETLNTFAAAIVRGRFPAFPDDHEINSCKYCPVREACRTRHDPEERYAVAQSEDPRTLLRELGAHD